MKVLLIDADWDQTSYLITNLAKAGIEVVLAAPTPLDPRGLGHYCRQLVIPDIGKPETLKALIANEPADVVLPLCEYFQEYLWSLPEEQTPNLFPRANSNQRLLLSDRRKMYELVDSLQIPYPKIVQLANDADLEKVATNLKFPLVLRGTQGLAGDQVKIVHDREQAETAYLQLINSSPELPFAQIYVTGQRCLIGGLFHEGKMLQWFSQTTIEASNPPTGPSIRVRSIRDDRLTGYTEKLFEAMNWSGLACAEFIRDQQGNFYFLEVNPRPWAAIQAAHYCGVPLMNLFADYLLKKEIPKTRINFPADKDVTLFPQFIIARLRNKKSRRWQDAWFYIHMLASMPWGRPRLLKYFLRKLWWTFRG